jgi:hypothetical protein
VDSFRKERHGASSAALSAIFLLLTLFTLVSFARAQDELEPPLDESQGQSSWFWVVPRVTVQAQEEWVLSGFYAGLGSCKLDLALLDREGHATAHARWELVAGQPADYRLDQIGALKAGAPLTLVISGLQARPPLVAFSLATRPAAGCERELRGSWLQGDIEWIPGLKGKR